VSRIESGGCPKCNGRLNRVNVEHAEIVGGGTNDKGINYVCPHCNTVLSVAIDPLALKSSIVSEILRALGMG